MSCLHAKVLKRFFVICFCHDDDRPNVHDEPFFRRRISDVWYRRDPVSGERPGRSGGPDDFHIPQDDQVHFPQVWSVR